MIKSIHIDNFKSLVDFSADLSNLTVFIGKNASGKSTVLQAIQFIAESTKNDYDVLLSARNWTVDNIRSKLTDSKKIIFDIKIETSDDDGTVHLFEWNTEIIAYTSKNEMFLDSEKITADGKSLLDYKFGKSYYLSLNGEMADADISFSNILKFHSSALKNIRKSKELDPRLMLFMDNIDHIMSFELLTPDKMRLSSRGTSDSIEASGKNLPSFIKKLNQEQKNSFMRKIKWLLEGSVVDIDAETKGQPGWTQIKIEEKYKEKSIRISSKEMSDGMLRLIAFVAISEIQSPNATYLLDEIENGINMEYIEKLIKLFSEMAERTKSQIILTTHSTLFMDYFDPESFLLLSRGKGGETISDRLFDKKKFKQQLEYMYPGEIILNMNLNAND
ncbi:AAA family ATPase [Butyrivibrio fibrisolvens]|uniref:AAA family ATPase n=1 Tax=Butyrivibrio fibrisolvens TaxID=831 RepID=UPI0004153E26|nr:ATP-binding protein [Butyrivibrio fibrisolvens]